MSRSQENLPLERARSFPEAISPLADLEERFVSVDGAQMRYLRAGVGPALVLLHGLMGYSFSWRFSIPALSRHATVYAVDMLGTGFSALSITTWRRRRGFCALGSQLESLVSICSVPRMGEQSR